MQIIYIRNYLTMNIYVWDKELKELYIGNTKIKEVYLGKDKIFPASRLPSAYQEVEWIWWTNGSNSVAQVYINTGVNINNNIWAWTEMLHPATRNDVQWFSDCNDRSPRNNRWGITSYPSGKWCPQWVTWHQTNVASNINQWYDIKLNWNNNKQTLIDGENIYSLWNDTFSDTWTIWIWDVTYNWYGWKCKYFKISDWTTLVRDFVPCYRKSDGEIWMYDLINNQFYTNSWTLTFTKWPDVN